MLSDKASDIAKIPKIDRYQRGLTLMPQRFFDETSKVGVLKGKDILNHQLVEELYKPIIRKTQNILEITFEVQTEQICN